MARFIWLVKRNSLFTFDQPKRYKLWFSYEVYDAFNYLLDSIPLNLDPNCIDKL